MPKTLLSTVFALAFFAFASCIPHSLAHEPTTPAIPNTATDGSLTGQVLAATTTASFPEAADKPRTLEDMRPLRVRIPSIGLSASVENMGILKNGALDVPSGKTNNVGWWAGGAAPGQVGSAVLDAHVFAAFKNLRYAKVGADIYVDEADGTTAHFVVAQSMVYPLAQTPQDLLYNQNDQPRLNLITCAGHLTADHSTYDHRLIVYAVLAK